MLQCEVFKVQKAQYKNYCYAVHDKNYAVLIDPAWDETSIQTFLMENALIVTGILVTHHHHDHIDLAVYFAEYYQTAFYLSQTESDYYKIVHPRLSLIQNESELNFSNISIYPIKTPGHTKGSLCYWINRQFLFTGDTLFNEGCGICVLDGGSELEMFYSLQKLKSLIPDRTQVFPGHMFRSSLGQSFLTIKKDLNLFLMLEDESHFVLCRQQMMKNIMAFK